MKAVPENTENVTIEKKEEEQKSNEVVEEAKPKLKRKQRPKNYRQVLK